MVIVRQRILTRGALGGAEVHVRALEQAGFKSSGEYDILHTHLPRSNILGWLFRRPGTKHVCTVHNVYDEHVAWRGRRWLLPLARIAWQRAGALIAISGHIGRWLLEEQGIQPEKLQVIPYGLEPMLKHALSPPASMACIGRLEKRKNQEFIIRALPYLKATQPQARLYLIGRDGGQEPWLKHLAKLLKVSHMISFLGELPNEHVRRILRHTSIYIQPSLAEGLGLALMEALACGVPNIIASDLPAFREFCPPEAWLIRTSQWLPRELAFIIDGMCKNAYLNSSTSELNQAHARRHFSLDKMILAHRRLYESL